MQLNIPSNMRMDRRNWISCPSLCRSSARRRPAGGNCGTGNIDMTEGNETQRLNSLSLYSLVWRKSVNTYSKQMALAMHFNWPLWTGTRMRYSFLFCTASMFMERKENLTAHYTLQPLVDARTSFPYSSLMAPCDSRVVLTAIWTCKILYQTQSHQVLTPRLGSISLM